MDRVPPLRLVLDDGLTPDVALDRLRGLPHTLLLESAVGGGRTLLSADPRLILRWHAGETSLGGPARAEWTGREPLPDTDPLSLLGDLLARPGSSGAGGRRAGAPFRGGPFCGGWIGYLGYETADLFETLPGAPGAGAGLPDLWMAWCDWAVVWGPDGRGPRVEGAPLPGGDVRAHRGRVREIHDRLREGGRRGAGSEGFEGGSESSPRLTGPPRAAPIPLEEAPGVFSTLGQRGYVHGVEQIREHVRAGELFQANLTHLLAARCPSGGRELYRRLRARSPSAFSAYLDTGWGEVASVSPESFLSLRDGHVETRPIKGTAPRSGDPERDRELAAGLLASEKDRAENVMIVDLLRNDLSRVCRLRSVRVPSLVALERHPTVHHLVSTVRGELAEGVGAMELLRATLPAGSISGAPKIRALELLRGLEPVRRGVYTGALGLVEKNGDVELSVAIRTAAVSEGWAWYGVGGGITLASRPEAEWRESMDKAVAFLEAVSAPRPDSARRTTPLGGRAPAARERPASAYKES